MSGKHQFDRILEKDLGKLAEGSTDDSVSVYVPAELKRQGMADYSKTKEKYGALAVTDAERQARSQRDRRFSLSPIVRKTLSVEEEENRVIEERLKDRITALAEEVKGKAYQEGFQKGSTEGYAKAYQEFKKEGAERLSRFESLLKQAEEAKFTIFKANERFLVELVYRIARLVIHKDIEKDHEFLNRLVLSLLNRINVKENVTVRIHPNDAQTMVKLRKDIETEMEGLKNLKIEISQKVKSGGCIIETDWNIVDASLDTQLEGIYEGLMNQTAPKIDDNEEDAALAQLEAGPVSNSNAEEGTVKEELADPTSDEDGQGEDETG